VARFYFQPVADYLTTILALAVIALIAGWQLGRRQSSGKSLSPTAAGMLLAAGIFWLLAARLARSHADTDGFGADAAGWFVQSGKWFVLLGAMLFGHV
jgi:hypothetical protein